MSPNDILIELLRRLEFENEEERTISWQETRHWSAGAIGLFEGIGLLRSASPATTIECPGCEENCFMPVLRVGGDNGRPVRAFIVCDQREDIGRLPVRLEPLQQWTISEQALAVILTNLLSIREKPRRESGGRWLGRTSTPKGLWNFYLAMRSEMNSPKTDCLLRPYSADPVRQDHLTISLVEVLSPQRQTAGT